MDIIKKTALFYSRFDGEKGVAGKSAQGRPVYYFKVVKSAFPTIICQYGIHAREYITSYLALEQIKDFVKRGVCGTVYFLPMTNPDGVNIALKRDPLYKANANGVDLNVNFDAEWGTGVSNVRTSGAENYIGTAPFSEKETRVLRDFTLAVKPDLTVSYHSKGEEIYYSFGGNRAANERSRVFALAVAEVTGYAVKDLKGSAGGYKDWCIAKCNIPALTIEVGDDRLSHPIREEHVYEIFNKNAEVINILTGAKGDLWK